LEGQDDRKIVGLAVVMLCFTCVSSRAETAGEVSGRCAVYDNAVAGPDQRVTAAQSEYSQTCWGAFASLQDLMVVVEQRGNKPILEICAQPESTRLELVHVFRHYVREHAEHEHEPFGIVLLASMRSAFPCR
jgi:hypothetical protein